MSVSRTRRRRPIPPTRPPCASRTAATGKPTLKVRVRIPEGIVAVKPMPKAGWKLETTKGAYVRAYQVHGEAVSEGVTDIVWTGSLDDGHYDEFVFQARFTDAYQPGATVFFPVVQECDGAVGGMGAGARRGPGPAQPRNLPRRA